MRWKELQKQFNSRNLEKEFELHISTSTGTGVDGMTADRFRQFFPSVLEVIHSKIGNGSFAFTQYKERLLSKGSKRAPRVISVPTVRDRVVLRVLNDNIRKAFSVELVRILPIDMMVRQITDVLSAQQFKGCFRTDVENFYPSIQHDILLKDIRRHIRSPRMIKLIIDAISTPTTPQGSSRLGDAEVGVPQGLSISNTLAHIYMTKLDEKFSRRPDVRYFRYVDDILIFCDDPCRIAKSAERTVNSLGMQLNPKKTKILSATDTLEFIGFQWKQTSSLVVTVRPSSVRHLEASLARLFTDFKNGKFTLPVLVSKVNLRITGCVSEGKKYGWLFYFSQINDVKLLYHLDWIVTEFASARRIQGVQFKRFVRAYHEIRYNTSLIRRWNSYIPKYDIDVSIAELTSFIEAFGGPDTSSMTAADIKTLYKSMRTRELNTLEKDLQPFS